MYTRSYGSRPSISPRALPPDYGGTALVIPQPESEREPTPPPRPEQAPEASPAPPMNPPRPEMPSRPSEPPQQGQGTRPRPPLPPRRSRFTGRRSPAITPPPMPQEPDFDPRRPEEREAPPSSRRDPLGAPPFGGGAQPFGGGGQPFRGEASSFTETAAEAEEAASRHSEEWEENDRPVRPSPFSTLSLRQDDLLLLGLLLFLLHEQDEEGADCRDALLLLAVLFVSGL